MKTFFLWISLIITPLVLFSQIKTNNDTIDFFNKSNLSQYNISIQTNKAEITGVLVLKDTNNTILGTVINEFGINAFDFIYQKDKQSLKLIDVISFIDKWYIKKVLRDDLEFMFSSNRKEDKTREMTRQDDGTIVVKNKKYDIIYTLTPFIEQIEQEKDEID
ncbi:MAG: hypothetical protein LKE30_03020 [Bacteroidales bacterium]|jgi:hypothetical protein|nr:hypothetical protein [Bacteroidales bacterium]